MKTLPVWALVLLVGSLCATIWACGGEVVGIGNSGNRIGAGGVLDEVAAALGQDPATPEVTDAMVSEILSAILRRASEGDSEAAMIVLSLRHQQRQAESR